MCSKKKDVITIAILVIVLAAATLFWVFYRETLKVGSTSAIIDDSNKTITVNLPDGSGTNQALSFNFPFKNDSVYIKPEISGTKKISDSSEQKLTNGASYDFKDFIFQGKIIIKSGSQKTEYDLMVTTGNLPVIKINTSDKGGNTQEVPGSQDDNARLNCNLSIFSPDSSLNQTNVAIEIKTLGDISNDEKISYSFNIKETTIKNFTPKILDFEDSKSFKLNPLNLDPSLMRIKLSYDIFSMLADDIHLDIAPKSEYIEVFINDEYKGVYLIEERVNNELLHLPKYSKKDKNHSVIYEAQDLFADFENGIRGFTQKEPDLLQTEPYMEPLINLADFINNAPKETFDEQIGSTIDMNNAIDSQILFLLSDNQEKTALNQYIYKSNAANASRKFFFCPGDYYMSSFGIDGDSAKLKSFKSFTANLLFDRLYESPEYSQNFKLRWNNLRKEMLAPENINKLIDSNIEILKDARERNFKGFPIKIGGYAPQEISFKAETDYMKEFIKNRLLWLDGRINDPPVLKIGPSNAKIYEDHNAIFCALPAGSDPLQPIEYDFGSGAEVYIDTKSYGTNNIYSAEPNYSDFYKYDSSINQSNKNDNMLIFVDKPKTDATAQDKMQIVGWALNPDVKDKVDIESILIFDGPTVGKETYLGKATANIQRQDVSDYLKNPFYINSGFKMEINTFKLVNGKHEFYIYAFAKNGKYSVYVLPLEINNKDNVPGMLEVKNGQGFDFKDFVFHGSMIIKESGSSKEYDLWVTTGSLPVISVSTSTPDLNVDTKIDGKILIVDESECFEGNIGIKFRGWYSYLFSEKKQYRIELFDDYGNPKNASLLGLPRGNDWVLFGTYIDKTMIRNAAAFKLSNEIGLYAPGNKFAELFLADTDNAGDYWGVYSLTEKIKVGKNRVDITKVPDADKNNADVDSAGSNINDTKNGFMLEIRPDDRTKTEDLLITTNRGTILKIKYPDKSEITGEQTKWLTDYINAFEETLYGDGFTDPVNGYYKYVDMDSLVDYMLISELFKNYNTFNNSTVITIDVEGKINFGPVWDFDFSSGNTVTEPEFNQSKGWAYANRKWAERFFLDENFKGLFSARWKELRDSGVISDQNIGKIIDGYVNELADAQNRNYKKWPWPNEMAGKTDHYIEEINNMRIWLDKRTEWLDKNMDLD